MDDRRITWMEIHHTTDNIVSKRHLQCPVNLQSTVSLKCAKMQFWFSVITREITLSPLNVVTQLCTRAIYRQICNAIISTCTDISTCNITRSSATAETAHDADHFVDQQVSCNHVGQLVSVSICPQSGSDSAFHECIAACAEISYCRHNKTDAYSHYL